MQWNGKGRHCCCLFIYSLPACLPGLLCCCDEEEGDEEEIIIGLLGLELECLVAVDFLPLQKASN